jgi:hypothetical protein
MNQSVMHRPLVVLDAPSNLGLRPPQPGVVPGVYKLAARCATSRLSPGSARRMAAS